MNLIKKNVSLKDKNWFETGGCAEYYCNPKEIEEYIECCKFAKENNLKITILGAGANVCISDHGISGLVITPKSDYINYEINNQSIYLRVGAGLSIDNCIEYCLENNILGLEEFSGIPGTIGGALYINIHYFKFLISEFVYSAKIINIETLEVFTVNNEWFEFGYDHSKLFEKKYCLIETIFKLKSCEYKDAYYAKGRSYEIIRHRKQRYPYKGTCGSFFRNFHDHEVTLISNGKKNIYSAYYLDNVCVKGSLKIGDAGVSRQHANMIVNFGNATSQDILNVAIEMQKRVLKEFGILLKSECEFLGFENYPILK